MVSIENVVDSLLKELPHDPYLFIGKALAENSGIHVKHATVRDGHLFLTVNVRGAYVDIPKFPISEVADFASLEGTLVEEITNVLKKFPSSADVIIREISEFLTIDVGSFLIKDLCGRAFSPVKLAFPVARFEDSATRLFFVAGSAAEAKAKVASLAPQPPQDAKKPKAAAKKGVAENPVAQVVGSFLSETIKIAERDPETRFLLFLDSSISGDFLGTGSADALALKLPANVALVTKLVDPHKLNVLVLRDALTECPFVSLRSGADEPNKQEISTLFMSAAEASNATILFGDYSADVPKGHRLSAPSPVVREDAKVTYETFVRKLVDIDYPFLLDQTRTRQTFASLSDGEALSRTKVKEALTGAKEQFEFSSTMLAKFKFDFEQAVQYFFE